MKILYKGSVVYRRLENEVVVYRCFERLTDGKVFIQSADRVRLPIQAEALWHHERQFWELLLDSSPAERGTPYSTIEEAIEAFDNEFEIPK